MKNTICLIVYLKLNFNFCFASALEALLLLRLPQLNNDVISAKYTVTGLMHLCGNSSLLASNIFSVDTNFSGMETDREIAKFNDVFHL